TSFLRSTRSNRWPAFVRSGSNQFPVGALVGRSNVVEGRRIRPPLDLGSTVLVFSSVLREPTQPWVGRLSAGYERFSAPLPQRSAVAGCPNVHSHDLAGDELESAVRRPLRTA